MDLSISMALADVHSKVVVLLLWRHCLMVLLITVFLCLILVDKCNAFYPIKTCNHHTLQESTSCFTLIALLLPGGYE